MADITYVVKRGDTLWEIAKDYLSVLGVSTTKEGVDKLVELNHITDPDYIVVGQKLKITGTPDKVKANTTSKVKITVCGLQSDTTRTVYATWQFDKDHLKEYEVCWQYYTANKKWFDGDNSRITSRQSVYTAPQNALQVRVKVKPHSTTYTKTVKKKEKEVNYWNGGWCSYKTYKFSSNPPTAPSTPTVTIEKYALTARLDNLNVNGTDIQFNIVKDDSKTFKTATVPITRLSAAYTCNVDAGSEYKVRCRAHRDGLYSAWSEYSSAVTTIPAAPGGITVCRANSETSVYLEWEAVKSAKTYELQYATKLVYFEGSDAVQSQTGIETTKYEKTGLETGEEYFFRVRAVNDKGESPWTAIKSVVIGSEPEAPTTWSSTSTVTVGDPLTLYWVHNAEDGSSQTIAELEITADGTKTTYTIENLRDEDEKDKTSSYVVDTSGYGEGTKLQWRVRTAGVTRVYGDWSVLRTVDVYAPVTLELKLLNNNGESTDTVEAFPLRITALAGPKTQAPIGYHVEIISNETYETADNIGNVKMVNAGDAIYSKYFDVTDALDITLSAGDVDLENNVNYSIACVVSMNSGLTAEESIDFTVAWEDAEYEPNASIIIDEETYTAYIRPFCDDENGEFIPGVTLSVYRREFDGTFTEIATGIENLIESEYENLSETSLTFVADTSLEVVMPPLMSEQMYSVYWNGEKYTVAAKSINRADGTSVVCIGNETIDTSGLFTEPVATGEPFFVMSLYDADGAAITEYSTFQNENHVEETVTARIVTNVSVNNTFVTDPHPSLDYARYRIVAIDKTTGAVSFCDLPGYPVGGDAVIIQWDEEWSSFDVYHDDGTMIEDEADQSEWAGSMLKLLYNIDVSDSNSLDVELVEYIGREHPVSYYGTQLGTTATWSMEIEKDDMETVYALRRLSRWKGDVYVREPSGTGYWANIKVSMSRKHCELTIPVSMSITRVEGGI